MRTVNLLTKQLFLVNLNENLVSNKFLLIIFQFIRDAGGALLVNGIHIGSSSWMYSNCLIPPYVSVFTQIGPYVDWIREKTGVNLELNMFLSF